MSKAFREVFQQDIRDTFLSEETELTTWREFSLIAQPKMYNVKRLLVVWNHDVLQRLSPVILYGQLLVADVVFLTRKTDWPIRPRRQQVIWSPRDTPWNVMFCQEILENAYRIGLQKIEEAT